MGANDAGLDLDAIKARADAATEGPWNAGDYTDFEGDEGCGITAGQEGTMKERIFAYAIKYTWTTPESCAADADFIAHARQDVPALLAEVTRLEAESAGLAAVIERVRALPERDACLADDLAITLATSPADALEAVKADAWDEGVRDANGDLHELVNPHRTTTESERS